MPENISQHSLASTTDSESEASVNIAGHSIDYRAVAGKLTIGATEAEDATVGLSSDYSSSESNVSNNPTIASMFYVAYFKKGESSDSRPLMFLYNGGPGSSTLWLHMGAFGPRRVSTADTRHEPPPYSLLNNEFSLLDAADLVFIDAPGTGFSRIFGANKEKSFWGTDPDARAFERFIRKFLTKFRRWNSPKYLLGESYGSTRTAIMSGSMRDVDLNGIVLLSPTLSFDNWIDAPHWNPGVDQPYALALPTYAATAFYHKKLPLQPADLNSFLKRTEEFAIQEYFPALIEGSNLDPAKKHQLAQRLHEFTGLPISYLMKKNLRVSGNSFLKQLQAEDGKTTGRLDSRFEGPDYNGASDEAQYDPQSTAILPPYTAAINDYVRGNLMYATNASYLTNIYSETDAKWDYRHQAPGAPVAASIASGTNVLPDLSIGMKANPNMKVLVLCGYFDVACPYFMSLYEMRHLPIPDGLRTNISYGFYEGGHMIYVNPTALEQLHRDVVHFISDSTKK